jgi:hypothetical protein
MRKQLTKDDIIGKKIIYVYEKKTEKIERFQKRMVFVRLSDDVFFNLDQLRYPEPGKPLTIWSCDYEKSFIPALSLESPSRLRSLIMAKEQLSGRRDFKHEPNLDSPIKAIISCEYFDIDTAILLENGFVLTIGIGEFDMGYDFDKFSEKQCPDPITLEIAG